MYDFPNSPTLNQVFGSYTWDGQKWAQTPGLIAATALPLMDGTPAVVGIGNRYAREDHVHPSEVIARAVRFDISTQGLTAPQQLAARTNISALGEVRVQKWTASGTYTPSAGMVAAIIECWGGGGGGGSVTGGGGMANSAGGGGAGGKSIKYALASDIGASKSVTIGAGGAGGPNGVNNGLAGGTTSVGTLCSALGGSGGSAANQAALLPLGGAGATAGGTGDFVGTGAPGNSGMCMPTSVSSYAPSGHGGSTEFGGGGMSNMSVTTSYVFGIAGTLGGGGGGAAANDATNSPGGGAGGAGYVKITEFCVA